MQVELIALLVGEDSRSSDDVSFLTSMRLMPPDGTPPFSVISCGGDGAEGTVAVGRLAPRRPRS
ncbi:MAG: hypothetical protein WKF40_07330 [Thermoleophilaceae bacterium]